MRDPGLTRGGPDAGPRSTVVPIDAPRPRRTETASGRRTGPARRRRRPSAATRNGPDRLALWAVVLGLLLAIVAATTARGAEEPQPVAPGQAASVELER